MISTDRPSEGKETPALSSPDSESTSGAVTPMGPRLRVRVSLPPSDTRITDVVYNTLEHTVTGDQGKSVPSVISSSFPHRLIDMRYIPSPNFISDWYPSVVISYLLLSSAL